MRDCTTVVAVDLEHLEEWKITWPTWMEFHPVLKQMPLLVIGDESQGSKEFWGKELAFLGKDYKLVLFDGDFESQREKMLSSFVLKAPFEIDTRWYLKLDTDAIAINSSTWPHESWFSKASDYGEKLPVFISSPWPYSKPADVLDRLDNWADTIKDLSKFQRLNVPHLPDSNLVKKPRIISWCFFGHTGWTRQMSRLVGNKLPVPSQDTYLWYCAERRGDFYRKIKMSHYGWKHVLRRNQLITESQRVLKGN